MSTLLPRFFCRRHVTIATFLTGVGIGLAGVALAVSPSPAWAQETTGGAGIPVSVAPVVRQDVPILLRNLASVQAFQSVLVRARVDGTLDRVLFTEGQDVHKGDVIAQLDPRPYQAVYDQAVAKKASDEAQLANAKRDLARSTQLAVNQFESRQTVDTRTSAVAQLEAQIKADDATINAAKVNLDYCAITAPFDGRTGLRQIDPGNVVRAADPAGVGIVTITQIHPIAVMFTLPQDALPRIQRSMQEHKLPVLAFTSDDKTQLATGELLTTDNAIDPTTGTIKLKAVFANQDNRLWPGQFINVRLELEVQKNVLTVPSVAVQRSQTGLYVFGVKPDSTVAVLPVELGQDDGHTAVITKGLDDGTKVVVNGMSRLQNGSRIVVAQAKPAS
jgi:multidrug efflux system membrane fusion protein